MYMYVSSQLNVGCYALNPSFHMAGTNTCWVFVKIIRSRDLQVVQLPHYATQYFFETRHVEVDLCLPKNTSHDSFIISKCMYNVTLLFFNWSHIYDVYAHVV